MAGSIHSIFFFFFFFFGVSPKLGLLGNAPLYRWFSFIPVVMHQRYSNHCYANLSFRLWVRGGGGYKSSRTHAKRKS